MIALIIPIYERPEYLRRTLNSLKQTGFGTDKTEHILLVDDGSQHPDIERICSEFLNYRNGSYRKYQNAGIAANLLRGLDQCGSCQAIITLDSDFEVKPDFINKLLLLLHQHPDAIVTGFNAHSHPVISVHDGYVVKQSIGGGNLCFTRETYHKHIRPALTDNMWDWRMCQSVQQAGGKFLCTSPSVAQHIGIDSTLNHANADRALDYDTNS